MQLQLFNTPPTIITKPKAGQRCKNCKHLYTHKYRNDWAYCNLQKTNKRTAYGHKKIKNNDVACNFFSEVVHKIEAKLFIQKSKK